MTLSDIQCLPTNQKCLWLCSHEGVQQIRQWLLSGLSLHMVASLLCIQCSTLYGWCERYSELAEITGRPLGGMIQADLSRPAAYRFLVGLDSKNRRGEILREHPTAEALWHEPFFDRYFASNGVDKRDYYADYLQKLTDKGWIQLSNLYTVAYCEVNKRGSVKILKPTL